MKFDWFLRSFVIYPKSCNSECKEDPKNSELIKVEQSKSPHRPSLREMRLVAKAKMMDDRDSFLHICSLLESHQNAVWIAKSSNGAQGKFLE